MIFEYIYLYGYVYIYIYLNLAGFIACGCCEGMPGGQIIKDMFCYIQNGNINIKYGTV